MLKSIIYQQVLHKFQLESNFHFSDNLFSVSPIISINPNKSRPIKILLYSKLKNSKTNDITSNTVITINIKLAEYLFANFHFVIFCLDLLVL